MWTIEQAIVLCRNFEALLCQNGFHVALGGSVLRDGRSEKDLDIFIYPHKLQGRGAQWNRAEKLLTGYGVNFVRDCDHEPYGDKKIVKEAEFEGRRIDFFFVS